MPAIGCGRADIGGAGRVLDECAGLEQVGSSAAAGGNAETGAAARQREACDRRRRQPVVGAGRHAVNAAGGGAGSGDRIAVGGLAAAEARAPRSPARFECRCTRRSLRFQAECFTIRTAEGDAGVGVRDIALIGKSRCARFAEAAVGGRDIGDRGHELRHRVHHGRLHRGGDRAGGLRQPRRGQPAIDQRNAAIAVEVVDQRVADGLLVAVQAAAGRRDEAQRQIEIGVVAVVAQARLECLTANWC